MTILDHLQNWQLCLDMSRLAHCKLPLFFATVLAAATELVIADQSCIADDELLDVIELSS